MSEALYRTYRPQVFADVVGQDHIERTLRNAIQSDRVSHAYLFTGPRGTGKTTTARLLAKALLCENGPTTDPCGTCANCRDIAGGVHPDVYELDAASRTGVDSVREEIIGRVAFSPTRGSRKVYIIDEVHMLSTAAFNALLKTLEEPPAHVVFILCTTDPQKVPETVRSRCQRFDFKRIPAEAIAAHLARVCEAEGVTFEAEALARLAQQADGGMRDALSSLEQCISYCGGNLTAAAVGEALGTVGAHDVDDLVCALGRRDTAAAFRWTARFADTGADFALLVQTLTVRVRDLYVRCLTGGAAGAGAGMAAGAGAGGAGVGSLEAQSALFGPERLAYLLGVLGDLRTELRKSADLRLTFEIALTRMTCLVNDARVEALAARVEALEMQLKALEAAGSAAAVGGAGTASAADGATRTGSASAGAGAAASNANAGGGALRTAAREAAVREGAPARDTFYSSDVPESGAGGAVATSSASAEFSALSAAEAAAVPAMSAAPSAAEAVAASAPSAGIADGRASVRDERASAAGCDADAAAPVPVCLVDLSNNVSLQRAWQRVLTAVKKQDVAFGAMFTGTKAVVRAGMLCVEFAEGNDFMLRTVQSAGKDDELADAIEQAFGARLPFAYTQAGRKDATLVPRATSAPVAAGFAAPGAAAGAAAPSAVAAAAAPSAATPEHSTFAAPASVRPAQAIGGEASSVPAASVFTSASASAPAPASGAPSAFEPPVPPAAFDEVPVDAYEGFDDTGYDAGYDDGYAASYAAAPSSEAAFRSDAGPATRFAPESAAGPAAAASSPAEPDASSAPDSALADSTPAGFPADDGSDQEGIDSLFAVFGAAVKVEEES